MSASTFQDGQIFKERCEDSPGILMFCQGDWWYPTPEREKLLAQENYLVLTAANGRADIPFWLPHPRCIGGLFGHMDTVNQARANFPDKVIERFEGVSGRFLRSVGQDLPVALHYAGVPYTATMPKNMKTLDVVSSFSPVPLKRGNLLLEALIQSGVSAYIFAHYLGADTALFNEFAAQVAALGQSMEYFHYPFDPYALIKIDNRIVIDCRPIGANNSIVSNYLTRARLYVHTSTTEGFSNAIMEALNNDVPVLICDDILGPLQNLSRELPDCLGVCPPDVHSLASKIRSMVAFPAPQGAIKSAFGATMNPFEINQRVVRGAQTWFERHGLPWKGHCVGILGGIQSRLDLSRVSAEETYRGASPIYNSQEAVRQYVAFHANIALQLGRRELAIPLINELKLLSGS